MAQEKNRFSDALRNLLLPTKRHLKKEAKSPHVSYPYISVISSRKKTGELNNYGIGCSSTYTCFYFDLIINESKRIPLAFGGLVRFYDEKVDLDADGKFTVDENGNPKCGKLALFDSNGGLVDDFLLPEQRESGLVTDDGKIEIEDISNDNDNGWKYLLMVPESLIRNNKEKNNEDEVLYAEVIKKMVEVITKGAKTNWDKLKKLLEENKQVVLTGAPGTGKTYLSRQIAEELVKKELGKADNEELTEDERQKYIHFCQFHPSYDYTDFVEGLRPQKSGDSNIGFERKDGIFKEFCKNAIKEPDKKFVFMIDEINRGDISKIFGELFYAIDPGYRGEKGKTDTQYQNLIDDENDPYKDGFYVPDNVYIFGTMNDIDRSVESMDFAIRRRFIWYPIKPEGTQDAILEKTLNADEAKNLMKVINDKIRGIDGLGEAYQLGASYFKAKECEGEEKTEVNLEEVWEYRVKPLLKEYLRGLPNEENAWEELNKCWPLKQNDESGKNQDAEDA